MRGIGNDIIEIHRIAGAISRHGKRFLDEIFTHREQEYCLRHQQSARHFAGRFAAKEAIVKALGTGFIDGINWQDIEIVNDSSGKPSVFLSDELNLRFNSPSIQISISHCKEYATAVAIYC
ncbi:MAG: holo-ACP synthase [Parachlamydiaceae bacterium]|nr:holo-ACP synthase [Parachlamydiaceae bacterium]